jgi:hypothetical protein
MGMYIYDSGTPRCARHALVTKRNVCEIYPRARRRGALFSMAVASASPPLSCPPSPYMPRPVRCSLPLPKHSVMGDSVFAPNSARRRDYAGQNRVVRLC